VNRYALAAALALTVGGAAQAAAIDLVSVSPVANPPPNQVYLHKRLADLAVAPRAGVVAPPANMSELPEPEVFAMMLVGLILIGYRASRDSSEKFK
jgi:hypothetical protein